MSGDFDWNDTSIIIHEQPTTAVYLNQSGQIVIRQQQYPEDDQYVYVSPEFAGLLVRAIMDVAGFAEGEDLPPMIAAPSRSDPAAAERQRRHRNRKRSSDVTAEERDKSRDATVTDRDIGRDGAEGMTLFTVPQQAAE